MLTKSEPYTTDDFIRSRSHPVRSIVGGALGGAIVGAVVIPDGITRSNVARIVLGSLLGLLFGLILNVAAVIRGAALTNPAGFSARLVHAYQRLAGYPPDHDDER